MDIDVFTWIDTDANIDKVIASSIAFLKYKENGLKSKSPNAERNKFQSKTLSLEKFLNTPLPNVSVVRKIPGLAEEVVRKAINEATDDAAETLGDLLKKEARFRKSVELLSARVKYLCDTLKTQNGIQTLRGEFRAKIKNAILNLRKRVSGTTGSVAKIRAQIERILYDFANSWESFKDSYNMNMVLLGGAGVGKTTLANAFAECLYAFGINSSDSISKPEKPDLIAQYSGQTAPLVYNVLYGSLEGVCFIDEAYSISGKPGGSGADFGQEFIDALVEFTQRFPGYLCLIVAGYKKEMKENFFSRNEGLYRRFPTVFELLPYPIEDIGRAYINQIIAKRELKLEDQSVYNTVDKALTFHSMLLKLLYFDTAASDIDDYYRMKFGGEDYNFFEKYTFNLEPVLSLIYLSPVENKRNVLKAYILRYVFAIKEGDLFPNQMGDIQNYVDKTLKQENVFFGNTITMADAQKTMNAYFSIRANHHVYLLDRGQGIPSIEFATHGQTASDFANSVLLPFLKPIVTFEGRTINLNDPIEDNRVLQHLEKAMGELYTKAVSEVYSDFKSEDGEKRPPSFVQYEFLKFEADTLERMNKERIERGETGRTRLKYFETVETREEDSDLSMSGGAMPVRPKKSPAEECGALARQESGAHKDGLVAAAASPPSPEVTKTLVLRKERLSPALQIYRLLDENGFQWILNTQLGKLYLNGPLSDRGGYTLADNLLVKFPGDISILFKNTRRVDEGYATFEGALDNTLQMREDASSKTNLSRLSLSEIGDVSKIYVIEKKNAAAPAASVQRWIATRDSLDEPMVYTLSFNGVKMVAKLVYHDRKEQLNFDFYPLSIADKPDTIEVEFNFGEKKVMKFVKDGSYDYKSISNYNNDYVGKADDQNIIYAVEHLDDNNNSNYNSNNNNSENGNYTLYSIDVLDEATAAPAAPAAAPAAPAAHRLELKKVVRPNNIVDYIDSLNNKYVLYWAEGKYKLMGGKGSPVYDAIEAVFVGTDITLPMKGVPFMKGSLPLYEFTDDTNMFEMRDTDLPLDSPGIVSIKENLADKTYKILVKKGAAQAAPPAPAAPAAAAPAAPAAAAPAPAPAAPPAPAPAAPAAAKSEVIATRETIARPENYKFSFNGENIRGILDYTNMNLTIDFQPINMTDKPDSVNVTFNFGEKKVIRFDKKDKHTYLARSNINATLTQYASNPDVIYAYGYIHSKDDDAMYRIDVVEDAPAAPLAEAPAAPAPAAPLAAAPAAPAAANAPPPPTARVGSLWTAQQTDVPSEFTINGAKWRLEISPRDILTITPAGILRGLPTELSISFESSVPGFENQGRWMNFKKEKSGNTYRAVQIFGSAIASDTSDKTHMYALATSTKAAGGAGAERKYKIIHLYQRGGRRNFVFTRKLKRN